MLLIWPDLYDAVAVFRRCRSDAISGLVVHWLGISATELHSALMLVRIPRSRWPDVSDDVVSMGSTVADAMNKRTPNPEA